MTVKRAYRYDVVVVGGGAAGIAAAVGAMQLGARTLLVERYGFLGGAATNANVLSYCGFYAQGDAPRRMVGGVGWNLLAALEQLGLNIAPRRSPSGNWIVMLDSEAVKVACDQVTSNVDTRLHCTLVAAHHHDGRISAVELHDHAGRITIEAAAFVDASGDADLGYLAGAVVDDGVPAPTRQSASFPVRIGGVAPDLPIDRAALAEVHAHFANEATGGSVRMGGGHTIRLAHSRDLWWMGIDLVTGGLDSGDLTRTEQLGRALAWRFVQAMRRDMPGYANAFIVATGPQVGVRDTRQIVPRYALTDDDVLSGRQRDDGVARGCWPAEVHHGFAGPRFHPIGGDGFYHVPLAALHSLRTENLWLAGRVIGCAPQAYGSLRVMGTAFATGQAAGVAAAQVANGGGDDDVRAIQAALMAQDAIV